MNECMHLKCRKGFIRNQLNSLLAEKPEDAFKCATEIIKLWHGVYNNYALLAVLEIFPGFLANNPRRASDLLRTMERVALTGKDEPVKDPMRVIDAAAYRKAYGYSRSGERLIMVSGLLEPWGYHDFAIKARGKDVVLIVLGMNFRGSFAALKELPKVALAHIEFAEHARKVLMNAPGQGLWGHARKKFGQPHKKPSFSKNMHALLWHGPHRNNNSLSAGSIPHLAPHPERSR